MLPLPTTSKTQDDYHRRQAIKLHNQRSPHITVHDSLTLPRFNLLTRTRTPSNLAVLVLALITSFSLLLNLKHYLFSASPPYQLYDHGLSISQTPAHLPPPIRIPRPSSTTNLTHLIIVPCHSIFLAARPEDRAYEESWTLSSFQRGRGRQHAFWAHIAEGARRVLDDPRALLVFSGGQTSKESSMTEADSYLRLALLSDAFHPEKHTLSSTTSSSHDRTNEGQRVEHDSGDESGPLLIDTPPFERATSEPFALDSFQNLLFSIARFQHLTGFYPTHITIIGYELKRQRFTTLHAPALRWPADQLTYVGIGLDPKEPEHADAWAGEQKNALEPFKKDLYGCHGFLRAKREGRNPAGRVHPYGVLVLSSGEEGQKGMRKQEEERSMEEQAEFGRLLRFCPPAGRASERYDGLLPWDEGGDRDE